MTDMNNTTEMFRLLAQINRGVEDLGAKTKDISESGKDHNYALIRLEALVTRNFAWLLIATLILGVATFMLSICNFIIVLSK